MHFLEIINWTTLLFGEKDMSFSVEIIVRTLIMYFVILVGLRLMGKRGVRQLSVFELVVIIGLGSSAGDPMFYQEVGVFMAVVVFVVVIAAYRLTTYFTGKSKKFERMVEGETVCLISEGKFCFEELNKEDLGQDEFFAELRTKGVSQIGQVEKAYLETSGEVSVFFYDKDAVKPGLPILPHEFRDRYKIVPRNDLYACAFCGNTAQLKANAQHECEDCKRSEWVKASERKVTKGE